MEACIFCIDIEEYGVIIVMRWKYPTYGARRIVEKYAFLPIKVGAETRWLERVVLRQQWVAKPFGGIGWVNNRFMDKIFFDVCIPQIYYLVEMKEKTANRYLLGNHRDKLRASWGKPDVSLPKEDLWRTDDRIVLADIGFIDTATISVIYDDMNKVEKCKFLK